MAYKLNSTINNPPCIILIKLDGLNRTSSDYFLKYVCKKIILMFRYLLMNGTKSVWK